MPSPAAPPPAPDQSPCPSPSPFPRRDGLYLLRRLKDGAGAVPPRKTDMGAVARVAAPHHARQASPLLRGQRQPTASQSHRLASWQCATMGVAASRAARFSLELPMLRALFGAANVLLATRDRAQPARVCP